MSSRTTYRAFWMVALSLATWLSSFAARAAESNANVPSPAELAPIVIPPHVAHALPFARQLSELCEKLIASAPPSTQPDAQAMKQTCESLRDGRALTIEDLEHLRSFKQNPSSLQRAAGLNVGIPAGAIDAGALTSDLLGNVVEGLSKFIYDRAKAEAGIYLAQQLRGELCSDEAKPFFPNLCLAFEQVDFNVSLTAIGSYLAAAARKDIDHFPDTALVYGLHAVKDKGANDDIEKQRALARQALSAARLALAYYREVSAGRHPLEVAQALHGIDPNANGLAKETFQAMQFASELVDAVTQQDGWNELSDGSSPIVLRCYAIGTLFTLEELRRDDLQLKTDDPFEFKTKPERVAALSTVLSTVPNLLKDLVRLRKRADEARQPLNVAAVGVNNGGFNPNGAAAPAPAPASTASEPSDRADYAAAVTSLLTSAVRATRTLAPSLGVEVSSKLSDAVFDLAALGQLLVNRQSPGDTVLAIVSLVLELDRQLGLSRSPVLAKVEKALPFLAQLAQAKSADEVASVIQAAAVPVSTYQIKSKRPFVALNALVGVAGGSEEVYIGKTAWSPVLGPFAPVGVHATTPTCFGHIGGFLSVINLGSLVGARFDEDTKKKADGSSTTADKSVKVELVNILAPGAFLTFGAGSSPFVFGLGAQVLPARQITKTAADGSTKESTVPAVQALTFASIDVPLFGF